MQNNSSLEIYNETKSKTPSLDFLSIKNDILGKNYSLTLSILLGKNSKKINIDQRGKDYTPNTLSFQYTKNSGEIILTPQIISKEMSDYSHDYHTHFLFLYIHSLLHLKKHDHGSKMENLEKKFLKKYR